MGTGLRPPRNVMAAVANRRLERVQSSGLSRFRNETQVGRQIVNTPAADVSAEKAFCFDYLERNAKAIATLNDSIFYFAELGMQEVETSGLMCELLESAGFNVERGISGFVSGFCATCGSGGPVIAIHTEYDANPDNSQASGVAEQKPIVDGAPGHCEGHNTNAAVLVASALAAKAAIDRYDLKGTLKVFGAPAEEQLISRPYFVRDGWFDDVDVAFADHIGPGLAVGYGLIQSALISATFTFHGETAHAGVAPWKGRDALDGVVLMDMGLAQYREHMMPTMRAQRVITNGGNQPNVVPRTAAVWWMFRDSTADGALKLFEQAKKIADGAALMTNTSVETDVISAVWPVRGNRTLAELFQREIEFLGPPDWTKEEDDLARAVQAKAKVPVEGLKSTIDATQGPGGAKARRQRCGGYLVEGADGEVLFSGQHSAHKLPPLGRGRSARHVDRAQGRARRGQGDGGLHRRVPEEPRDRRGSQTHLRGGARRRRIPPAVAASPEAAGRSQPRHDGKIPAAHGEALSQGEAGV